MVNYRNQAINYHKVFTVVVDVYFSWDKFLFCLLSFFFFNYNYTLTS